MILPVPETPVKMPALLRHSLWKWLPIAVMAVIALQMAYWNHVQARLLIVWSREREGRLIWETWLKQEQITPRQFLETPALQTDFLTEQPQINSLAILGPQGLLATLTTVLHQDWQAFLPRESESAKPLANDRVVIRLFLRSGPPMGPKQGRHAGQGNQSGQGNGFLSNARGQGGPGPFGRRRAREAMAEASRVVATECSSASATVETVSSSPGGGPFEIVFDFPEPQEDISRALRWQVWLWLFAWGAVSGMWLYALSAWQRLSVMQQERQRENHLAAVGRMTARLAHEIKNPLGAVRGMTQLLSERLEDRPELQTHLQLMESETTRLEKLASSVLDFARPPTLQPIQGDLGALIREMVSSFQVGAPDIQIQTALPDTEISAWFDPEAGRQILLNLLNNAREASPEKTPVEISLLETPAQITVRISDRGTGLDPALQETLFEPFVSNKPRGHGLGLTISRRLARGMGGSLNLFPREGSGCHADWQIVRTTPEEFHG